MCLGFGTSAWLSRLPDVRDDLGLTPATIGTMLLIASLGSLLTLPTSGPIVTAIGARASGRIGVAIWALGIVCAGVGALNVSIPLATVGLVLLAAGNGLWGATMNIEAGLVQAAVRRTVVPVIQAMYAVGMLGGPSSARSPPSWACPSAPTSLDWPHSRFSPAAPPSAST